MDIDIMQIAKLCRIKIDSDVEKKTKANLKKIIESIKDLPEFDENENFFNPESIMPLREDVAKNCGFDRNDILKNAPRVKAGCVVVPKKID